MKEYPAPRLAPLLLFLAVGLIGAGPASAQDSPPDAPLSALCAALPADAATGIATPLDDLARVVEIRTGATVSRAVRRHSEARWPVGCAAAAADRPAGRLQWHVTPRPARVDLTYRSNYPDDRNNGALWAGRGVSTLLEAGVEAELSGFGATVSAALVPQLVHQQNLAFDFPRRNHAGFSQYIYPHYTTHIDLPHRHGPDPFSSVEWGQSYVRADGYGLAAGFSTENLWWGPAARYPIIMSNTAPGLPHLFIGTSGPTDVWIGWLDAELILARTTESDYFDQIPENDRHMLGGLSVAFSPRPLPGFWLGLSRVQHHMEDGWNDLGLLLATTGLTEASRAPNEIISFFGRWVFPEAGAEVYGEWAREDRSWDFPELLQEPDHSQAYTLGFQKLTQVHDRFGVRVQGELVALQELPELRTGSRPLPVFYAHDEITQGHTQRGQLLGAGVGLGADAQFIGVDVIADRGLAGLYVERVRRGTFSARALDLRSRAPYEHDTEITGGARSTFLHGTPYGFLSFSGSLAYTFRYNRDFGEDDTNWSFGLEAAWVPATGLRFP